MSGRPRERVTGLPGLPGRPPARLRFWLLGLLVLLVSTVVSTVQPSSMVWSGPQRLCADVAVTVAVKPDCSVATDLLDYRVTAAHSHGPPAFVDAQRSAHQTYYVLAGDTPVLVHNTGPCGTAAQGWANRADFSDKSTLSAKYDAHAADFGLTGNRNNANLAAFQQTLTQHMTAPGTKIFRFDYRGQGQAIGFIDPSTNRMVMLHADTGKFWTAYRLGDNQFMDIVRNGHLW